MSEPFRPPTRSWYRKFADAFHGLGIGTKDQPSFLIHLPIAILVLLLAATLQVTIVEWCVLVLCIGVVISAELFNSALEITCQSVTSEYDPNIERALNTASGAVLIVSITSAIAGSLIFLRAFIGLLYS